MPVIVPVEMPETCSECLFEMPYEDFCVDVKEGTFKHISRCMFTPEEVEDGYKDMKWLMHNRFKWCPLREYKED